MLLSVLCKISASPTRLREPGAVQVLAVGPFYSGNWVAAHLHAIGQAPEIGKVTVISPEPYRALPKIRYFIPPVWLRRLMGMSMARALTALRLALKERPDIVIGYHAPWNGVVGLISGRLCRARTAYFSVGGPAEIIGGGLYSEHALFRRIGQEDASIQSQFLHLIDQFDSVLTMGTGSAEVVSERWYHGAYLAHGSGSRRARLSNAGSRFGNRSWILGLCDRCAAGADQAPGSADPGHCPAPRRRGIVFCGDRRRGH